MPQQTSTFKSHFLTHMQDVAGAYHKLIACSWVPILQVGKLLSQGNYNMAWSGIEPATSRSRVRRANHSATLPLWTKPSLYLHFGRPFIFPIVETSIFKFFLTIGYLQYLSYVQPIYCKLQCNVTSQ